MKMIGGTEVTDRQAVHLAYFTVSIALVALTLGFGVFALPFVIVAWRKALANLDPEGGELAGRSGQGDNRKMTIEARIERLQALEAELLDLIERGGPEVAQAVAEWMTDPERRGRLAAELRGALSDPDCPPESVAELEALIAELEGDSPPE